jgi:hypothetical protein
VSTPKSKRGGGGLAKQTAAAAAPPPASKKAAAGGGAAATAACKPGWDMVEDNTEHTFESPERHRPRDSQRASTSEYAKRENTASN